LSEDERIRTRVFEDYDTAAQALETADFLVTYTCNVRCNEETEAALKNFVESGKRWYALHGTNSILEFLAPEGVLAPIKSMSLSPITRWLRALRRLKPRMSFIC